MSAPAFIHSLGSMGLFPSRAFIPAFLTALLCRFGPEVSWIKDSGVLGTIGSTPSWFTHDITLVILGLLSVLEIVATKVPEVREVMNEFDHYIKAGMATLTTYGVLGASDRNLVNSIRTGGGMELSDLGLSAAVGAGVLWLASLRRQVMGGLIEADADDHVGIQKYLMWMEDLWVGLGFLLLLIYPMLVLVLAAGVSGFYFVAARYLQHRADKQKVPCAHCKTNVHPAALYCHHCKAEMAQPHALGFLGGASSALAGDRGEHALALITRKRCPCCATRFEQRAARQTCKSCGHELLADRATQEAYVKTIDNRVPQVLAVSALLGLIPLVGMVAGLVYFRIKLVAPFRQYIGIGTGFALKWAVRLLNLGLILLQLVPPLGLIVVPLMAYTNYRAYRSVFTSMLSAGTPVKVPPPVFAPAATAPVLKA